MIKLFWNGLRALLQDADGDLQPRDPMMHPALLEMSERELADLPLSAGYCRAPEEGKCTV